MTLTGQPYGNMVTILKEGKRVNIEEEELRQDDTVVLQTGDIVPADLKLIEAKGLEIDEFDITGELLPVVKKAGIRSFLLTGDRADTAVKVGKVSGIVGDTNAFLTGRDIDKMGWSEAIRQSSYCSIFARLIPSQKGVLIALLQQNGHSIAMVGDGPNDGIALKVADIGISFVTNSSPIARKLSKILINDLADLQMFIEGAKRFQARKKRVKLLSILLLTVMLLGSYTWAFILFTNLGLT